MSTRRGFFASLFGGIAAAFCPRPAPVEIPLDDLYEGYVENFNLGTSEIDLTGFEFVPDADPACFIEENGRLKRVYPGKEPA